MIAKNKKGIAKEYDPFAGAGRAPESEDQPETAQEAPQALEAGKPEHKPEEAREAAQLAPKAQKRESRRAYGVPLLQSELELLRDFAAHLDRPVSHITTDAIIKELKRLKNKYGTPPQRKKSLGRGRPML